MERYSDYEREEETLSDSSKEAHVPRKPHKGVKIIREEPISLTEFLACPLAICCFRHHSCYEFSEMVERVKFHHELARLFVTHLDNGKVNLAGVSIMLSLAIISKATSIPNVSEQWNKRCKTRVKRLKAKLKRALRRKKEQYKLKILAEASLAHQSTQKGSFMPNFKKFGEIFDIFEFLKLKK